MWFGLCLLQSAVTQFSLEWLTPCLLLYTQRGYSKQFCQSPLPSLEPSVLLAETHSPRPLQSPTVHTSLSFHELPERGDLVGIDAEFVTLNQVHSEADCWSGLSVGCGVGRSRGAE